jgi:anion-transporting  ArsA/GET3 family ATPase
MAFLDGRALQLFLRPTGFGMRIVGAGAGPLLGALRRVTGIDLLADLTTFFGLLGPMTEVFSLRAREVEALLRSDRTAFVLVTSAQSEPIEEAIWFRRRLDEANLPFAGVVINRFHHDLGSGESSEELESELASLVGADLAARLVSNLSDYHVLAARDAANVARLERELVDGEPLLPVPQFDDDIHDVAGLLRVQEYLFATDERRAELIENLIA